MINESLVSPQPSKMPRREPLSDRPPPLPQFTLRAALTTYSLLGILLSIPLLGFGFTLTAGILATLFVLQLPLFCLFGAFSGGAAAKPSAAEPQEWDRRREERGHIG